MKKALIAAVLGLATVVTSYGQGHIIFDNYDSTPYMPVEWYQAGGYKGANTSDIHVDLLYTLGTASSASTDLGLSVPIDPTLMDSLPGGNHQGYFKGGVVAIPGYVSGPVTFQVEAWLTTGPGGGATYALAEYWDRGISAAWQESSLATGLSPANFFAGLPGPNGAPLLVNAIPEPSFFALCGIGGAALVLFRRKKLV